jgi:hypothetical protein
MSAVPLTGAVGTDKHFADNLVTFPTGVVAPVIFFLIHKMVGFRPRWIPFEAGFYGEVVRFGVRRNDFPAQLTLIHFPFSQCVALSGRLTSQKDHLLGMGCGE